MQAPSRILVVDDEPGARAALAALLREDGYTVETAADGFKALPKLEEFAPDAVLTDLRMPGMDGIELIRRVRVRDADCMAIVMTAFGAVETAVQAMREGAADYVGKPIIYEELALILQRALERRRLRLETRDLRARLDEKHRLANIVGASPQMQVVFDIVLQVAPSRATVLITGESGTGKELIAAAVHQHSPRSAGPFVKLHCAALAETLLESELFGHERGSFTGAVARRDGRFQQADGGTLFLDEIGEISASTQVKLLRFLQDHEIERVGGNQTLKLDVRIVAATNRDLRAMVAAGNFREDLFYRLNVVTIDMPALRQRPSDIPLLAAYFLDRFAGAEQRTLHGFDDAALERLARHDWPGNVRELENAIERAVVVAPGDTIRAEDLPAGIGLTASTGDAPVVPGASLAALEEWAILKTLEHTGGSTSRAADILGISTRKIQYRLHEYHAAGAPRAPQAAQTCR